MPSDDDDDIGVRRSSPRTLSSDVTLLAERVRTLTKRVAELEKKSTEVSTMINKGLGAAALIMGVGAVIGWLISVGGNIFKFFR